MQLKNENDKKCVHTRVVQFEIRKAGATQDKSIAKAFTLIIWRVETGRSQILHCFGLPYRAGVLNLAQGVFNSLIFSRRYVFDSRTVTLIRFASHMNKYIALSY